MEVNCQGTSGPPCRPVELIYLVQWSSTSTIKIREYMMHMINDTAPENADFRAFLLGGEAKLLVDVRVSHRNLYDAKQLMKHTTSVGSNIISSDTIDEALSQISMSKTKQKQAICFIIDDQTVMNNVPRVLFNKETLFIIFGKESNEHYKDITGSLEHVITISDRTEFNEAVQKVANLRCKVSLSPCDRDSYNEPRSTTCLPCVNLCQEFQNSACLVHCPHYVHQSRQKEIIEAVKAEYSLTVADASSPVDNKGFVILIVLPCLVTVILVLVLVVYIFFRKQFGQVLHIIRQKLRPFVENILQNDNAGTGQSDHEVPQDEPNVGSSLLGEEAVNGNIHSQNATADPAPETDTSQSGIRSAKVSKTVSVCCSHKPNCTCISHEEALINTNAFCGPTYDLQRGEKPTDNTAND